MESGDLDKYGFNKHDIPYAHHQNPYPSKNYGSLLVDVRKVLLLTLCLIYGNVWNLADRIPDFAINSFVFVIRSNIKI
jgi:hypothetical protein